MLHDRIKETLDRVGRIDPFGEGDYWLVDDDWGQFRHQLEFQNLELFRLDVIRSLQALLIDFPDWSISVRVDVPGTEASWPGMGLIIFNDRIVDELQRDYLPERFRQINYSKT